MSEPEIRLEDLSDRELLLITANNVNRMGDHEKRIKSLELWVAYAKGAWLALAGLFGYHIKSGH